VQPQAVALNKSLAAEVAMLDRARSALLAQNASGALRVLEQYRRERQTGILDPEATVLEIQALEKLGNRASAARLARQFIKSHPDSRHVESLRVLAAEAR
jgi:outer membrane protein assembly factor BamD (BamD/ComL family)